MIVDDGTSGALGGPFGPQLGGSCSSRQTVEPQFGLARPTEADRVVIQVVARCGGGGGRQGQGSNEVVEEDTECGDVGSSGSLGLGGKGKGKN